MRTLLLCLLTLMLPPLLVSAQPTGDGLDSVLAPLRLYLQAHATGDGDFIRQAFHPKAEVFWIADGALRQLTTEEFAARFSGSPADDEDERLRRIVSVDVTGNVAAAKIELDYPDVFFTDYLTLVREGDQWQVISKSFRRDPPHRP